MASLRVLHLSSEKFFRGGERQIAYLIEGLQKNGVENLVAARRNSEFKNYCSTNKIIFFELPFSNSFDLRSAYQLKNICAKEKIDIVHIHSAKSQGIAVLSSLLGNKSQFVLSRRVAFLPKQNRLTKWKYNHPSVKRIICVSKKVEQIMRSYVSQPEKCTTVYSGVDLNNFTEERLERNLIRKEFNIDEETLIIGNTGALEKEKDYFTFIRTIKNLIDQNIKCKGVIIGKGSLEEALKNYGRQLNIEGSLIFTGQRSDVLKLVSSLDIFLMTSVEEGLGTSVLDAFGIGVPVVATNAGGIPEMVIHEQTGLLANCEDDKMLAQLITRLMIDQGLKRVIIKNAKEKLKEFSKEITAAETLKVYKSL